LCHNAQGSITPTFVFAVERWSQQLSHENVNRTEASRHHVGYEVHALPTVFMEVEDSRQLSSLSFNILSNEFIASGQALTAKYHIVHPFVIRGLTRTTAAEFCCPPKNVQNKNWLEELWSITLFHKTRDQSKSRSTNSESSLGRLVAGVPSSSWLSGELRV